MATSEPTVSISLTVKNAAEALDFYHKALGAQELFRMPTPDGNVAHGEFMIGNTRLFISCESPDWGAVAMPEGTTASCLFSVFIEDCDASYRRALEVGATSVSEPTDQFWGMRSAVVRDPYGYRWSFNQQIEELTPEEIAQRAQELFSS